MFISFNADEIHELRVNLAQKLNAMPPEEAAKMFKESVARAEAEIRARTSPSALDSQVAEAI